MVNLISAVLPYAVLGSHIFLLVLVVAVISRKSWGLEIIGFVYKHAVIFAFLLSLSALLGSLFYSEVMGFEPCVLCWWIRLFLYPQVLIFGVALLKGSRGREAFSYALPLTILAVLVSAYFSYYSIGGVSLFPCTADGAGCSRVFVREFSYITIPMMSFTIAAYLLLLTWINKLNENSNA